MKYFRVKIGFGRDDFISIDETELLSAMKAQGLGLVAVFKEGTVSGNHIISIIPDYQRMMGWPRDAQLDEIDYREIGKARREECIEFLQQVAYQLNQKNEQKRLR